MLADPLGDDLLSLCAAATEPVVLVAPFIKAAAFARILAAIPSAVAVTCVTRWRPDEVAAGVSDLEVFDQIKARSNAKLFLHQHLHAKYYRSGPAALIGSANLTGRALGWTQPANLEILVATNPLDANIVAFEVELFRQVIPADDQIRQAVEAATLGLKATAPKLPAWHLQPTTNETFSSRYWLPTCPRPDLLYRVYEGAIGDMLLAHTISLAESDLAFLEPPLGLGEAAFNGFVGAMVRQSKSMQDLDQLTNQGLTDNVAAETIRNSLPVGHDFSPEGLWSVAKDWLIHFYPDQYDRVPAGEMLRKRRRAI